MELENFPDRHVTVKGNILENNANGFADFLGIFGYIITGNTRFTLLLCEQGDKLFPAPFGPRNEKISPLLTEKLIPSTALNAP
jgi:hypothetical protein